MAHDPEYNTEATANQSPSWATLTSWPQGNSVSLQCLVKSPCFLMPVWAVWLLRSDCEYRRLWVLFFLSFILIKVFQILHASRTTRRSKKTRCVYIWRLFHMIDVTTQNTLNTNQKCHKYYHRGWRVENVKRK